MTPRNILLVAGTRPNFVKAGPLMAALRASPRWRPRLLVVGQHRDDAMSREILEDLSLVGDDIIHLPIISTTLGARLGTIIDTLGAEINRVTGASVVVFGDVDTTLAGAIAAKRAQRRLIHVEAGLRSGDRCMPEELNRRIVAKVATLHFAPTQHEVAHLRREKARGPIVDTGANTVIDALRLAIDGDAPAIDLPAEFGLVTLHRFEMLRNGPYPRALQERIRGGRGHIDNATAGALAVRLAHPGLRALALLHLSETNNTPDVAARSVNASLAAHRVAVRATPAPGRTPALLFSLGSTATTRQLSLAL